MNHGLLRTAKNFLAGGISQLIGTIFLFIANIFMARKLGPSDFGTWVFLLSIGMIVWMIVENSITPVYLRRFEKSCKIFYFWPQLLGYSLFLGILGYFIFLITVFNFKQNLIKVAFIIGISIISLSLATACNIIFRAFEKQEFLAISFILHKILIFFLIFYFKNKLSLLIIALIFGISDFLYCFLNIIIVTVYFKLPIKINFSLKKFWIDLKESIIFSFAQLLRRFIFQIELLLGYFLVGTYQTGIFAVSLRVLQAASQTAQMALIAIFVFLNKKQSYVYELSKLNKLIIILLVLGIISGITNYLLAPLIIKLFGTKYLSSLFILKILSIVFPFLFLSTFFYYLFATLNLEMVWFKLQILFFILSLVTSYFLLKNFKLEGMLFSKILNEIFLPIIANCIIIQKIKNKNNSQETI